MGLLEISHPAGLQQAKTIVSKTKDGEVLTNGTSNGIHHSLTNGTSTNSAFSNEGNDEDDFAVLGLRNLLFDICNQNGGHGGSAIGMAAIGVALFKYVMRYNPSNPEWFDRDRFVLSNGRSIRNPPNIAYANKTQAMLRCSCML